MTDNELDKLFRDKLSSYEEAAPDVWEGITAGLASRRRWRIVRRSGYAAIAVAASLAAGLFLFKDDQNPINTLPVPEVVAEVVTETVPESAGDGEIMPVVEQIKKFSPKKVVAVVTPSEETQTADVPVNEITPDFGKTETEVSKETATQGSPVENNVGKSGENLPVDFWDEEETKRTHTSQISILSNLSPSSANGNMSGMNNPSYTGSNGGQQPEHSIQIGDDVKFYLPLTFGLQFKTGITDRFYVGAGLSYTYLVSKFDALIDKVSYSGVHNQQHYLGVPVKFYYNFAGSGSWNVYASLGGTVEKCVGNRYIYGSNTLSQKVSGVQFSANAGVGIEYWCTPVFGIYFDPSLAYYFKGDQPVNIRTQQPLQAKLELGFRFDI